ncbi:alpha/beta fold hydrolase [Amycolatopsis sp. ATCC 39116]|uniref:alpha/beta fold hydrolase n=1 Tax=Amycolatopsis sp. (strain ATCC 39116 / 75iv2) TaxID=385957 RepID=UPI0004805471|nr:alpha/beta fold hydrolase [Amycolatopsis sp. ATCC 39116]
METLTEESTSGFVEIFEDDLEMRIHYNSAGEGPAVIMIHGGGPGASGWSNFHRNIEDFATAGYRTILVDCPGFGRSDPIATPDASGRTNAKAIRGLMRELNIQKAHLVGNSMGGASAIRFALDHPERVDRLVVMGPANLGDSLFTPVPMEGIKLLMNLYLNPTLEAVEEMLRVFVYDQSTVTEELKQGRLRNIMRDDGLHLKSFVAAMENSSDFTPVDLSSQLRDITAKTLAIHGANDRFVPMDHALKVVKGIADCRLTIFNRCGHWVQWEHAEEFNRVVLDFLRS